MKKSIGERITVSKQDEELIIKILGKQEKWMESALLSWVVVWTLVGGYVLFYMLNYDLSREENLFFVVYLTFWGYFEFVSVKAWLYKRFGFELIRLDNEFLYHKVDVLGKGKLKRYLRSNIRSLRLNEGDPRSFSGAYSKSFWVIGNEQIKFDYLEKSAAIGMHLEEKEAKEVIQLLRKNLKNKS